MYLLMLAVIGGTSAVLAVLAWPHRRNRGFVHFFAMEVATTWWLFCYLGEQLDPAHSRFWFAAKFPGIGLITASWFLFTLNYVGHPPRAAAWRVVYVWPIVLGPLLLTNDAHRLFFREVIFRNELVGLNGPVFPFHLALSYAYTLGAVGLLVRDWLRTHRFQSVLLAVGTLLPLGANILNEFAKAWPSVAAWLPLNPTLPAFGLTATFLGWAVLRYRLLDPRPVARDMLFESMPDPVVVLNEAGVVVDANGAAEAVLGEADRPILGRRWTSAVAGALGWNDLSSGKLQRTEQPWLVGGATRWYDAERRALSDRHGRDVGALLMLRDITTRKQLEERLRQQSYSDELTGLSNRRHFEDESARLKASREFPVAIVEFDVDGLKAINDGLGHAAGDALLKSLASFLRHFFRGGDRVFRIGVVELVTLLPATTAAEADAVAGRLAEGLISFNESSGLSLRFSTGWAVAERPAGWEAALQQADAMLYRQKRALR
jgi:diguanylate cyclase (GGDEF)-like protein/PAS domain S-box-containing protein